MSSIASHTYSWDDADRLTKFDNSTGTENDSVYAYLPGSGMRYKRTQDTTVEYFIHDGDDVLGSYTAGGTLNARYVTPGLDDNLSETRGGSTYYYMQDGLGSVRNIVDSSETLQNRYDHYAFGNNIGGAQLYGVDNTYWYTGREYEWGGIHATHYYRNRYYVSALGIFASRDAMWADIHRGWGYVGNMPTYYVDPYGLGPIDLIFTGKWNATPEDWERSTAGQLFASDIYHGKNDPVWGNPSVGVKASGGVGAVGGIEVSAGMDAVWDPVSGEVSLYGFPGFATSFGLQKGAWGSFGFYGGPVYGMNCPSDYTGYFRDVSIAAGLPGKGATPGIFGGYTTNRDGSVYGYYGGSNVNFGGSAASVIIEHQNYYLIHTFKVPRLPSRNPFSWIDPDEY